MKALVRARRVGGSFGRLAAMSAASIVVLAAIIPATGAAQEEIEKEIEPVDRPGPTVLITGANRGLGLEFAKQYHAAGANVIATARRPDAAEELKAIGVRVEQLDVTDPASVAQLAAAIGDDPLDILINNAGVASFMRTMSDVDFDSFENVLRVNTVGPMRVTQALLPALRKGERKQIMNISSIMGSLAANPGSGGYGYRESKVALNMFTRTLAHELRGDGFLCIMMSPGWVRTDMGGDGAPLSAKESVSNMLKVLDGLTPEDTGKFYNHDGREVPW